MIRNLSLYSATVLIWGSTWLGIKFQLGQVDPLISVVYRLILALFGNVIAFGCYLTLVGNIGADRASYASLLFPIIALIISTLFEAYRLTTPAVAGVPIILAGNTLSLSKIDLAARLARLVVKVDRQTQKHS